MVDGTIYLIQNILLLPGLFPIIPLNTVTWSLSYEMLYYFTIPVIISLFNLHAASSQKRIYIFSGIALIFFIENILFGYHLRLVMFIAGIITYELLQHRFETPSSIFTLILVLGVFVTITINIDHAYWSSIKVFLLFLSFSMLCLTCFTKTKDHLALFFSWQPLRWLGNMSYSYYLIHGLTLKVFFYLQHHFFQTMVINFYSFVIIAVTSFLFSLIPAILLFVLIERPCSLSSQKNSCKKITNNTQETVAQAQL
jgi:peptidoglycan/LPS O-acetylase OafA/YrhL